MVAGESGSWLLLEEHFESGDRRFLDELYGSTAEKKLQAFAPRWLKDRRPFAREMLLAYIDDGCDRPHHRALVKKLYKNTEDAKDDELLAHFLVSFDRLLGRKLVELRYYDWAERETKTRKALISSGLPRSRHAADQEGRFTQVTRAYLIRRVFRRFRELARRDGERYFAAAKQALLLYRDQHLSRPEQLLDAWSLVHICYHGSPVIARSPRGARLGGGRALAELSPAPYAPALWRGRFEAVLDLFVRAPARTVRVFALGWLEREYAADLGAIPLSRLLVLLKSPHDDVQLFAVRRLKDVSGLESLPIGQWLELLEIEHPIALPILAELFEEHVAPSRLTLEECVRLARAPTAPVADLGLRWLRARKISGEPQIAQLLPIAEARTPSTRAEASAWLVDLLRSAPAAKPEHLREVVDSRFADAREAALPLLEQEGRYRDSPILWAALAESPYDEIRTFLVRHLEERMSQFKDGSIQQVWASTLLSVHRGSREKQRVLRQLADRLIEGKDQVSTLAPLFRVALRSVRPAERRHALAAVGRAAFERPSLRSALEQHFPELKLGAEDAVCR
ncbi:MAG: hypothetical protein IT384_19530 [Deltaproteobacteria bacterium]|nr:hypothetical protein [Deltaproteobacteria bacterium]